MYRILVEKLKNQLKSTRVKVEMSKLKTKFETK